MRFHLHLKYQILFKLHLRDFRLMRHHCFIFGHQYSTICKQVQELSSYSESILIYDRIQYYRTLVLENKEAFQPWLSKVP